MPFFLPLWVTQRHLVICILRDKTKLKGRESVCKMASKNEEPELQKEGHRFNVRIPDWPYEKWKLIESNKEDTDIKASPMHKIPVAVGPVFESLLQSFSPQLEIHNEQKSLQILHEITIMLKDSLHELGKSYKCFEEYRLVQAGSVAEKTKIAAFDEFDFLIVLDYFANPEYFQTVVMMDFVRIYVKDSTIVDLLPTECKLHSGTIHFLDFSLRSKFMQMFIKIFDSRLLPGWKRATTDEEIICGSGIASTLHLTCDKFCLDVDVDLCLCVPIRADDFKGALSIPNDANPHLNDFRSIQALLFGYISNIMELSPLELYAILGNKDPAFQAISSRITAPHLELSPFQSLSPEDGRIKTYCIAKCIMSAFLPKLSKIFGCKRCCHRLVRSYHIKNILLFMLKNYKEDSHWSNSMVPVRVLEIFFILKECMISNDESCYDAAVSKHCFPGTLYVENVTNLSPYYDSEEVGKFFFTPNSHKPFYELSSSPAFESHLLTGNKEADNLLREWFEKLNDKPWNSRQLLLDLFNFLNTLNETVY